MRHRDFITLLGDAASGSRGSMKMSKPCRPGILRRNQIAIAAIPIILMALQADADDALIPRGGIKEIRITSSEPAFGGATFGAVGAYEILRGKAYGTIDPQARANAGLTYLNYAPSMLTD
jgi:hypothetical protein